ncbi:VCBS repeat-containing protein [Clostridium swellfunianum]|uniref:FG-GAP repeat domain-containing protein n=1 Tax=Clostridium swellfunianum TaxID=1367462 RepID=UPI00202E379B|nr:VCBS repeat-containing protein [Clostridium swellfunianum]MCM0649850.1 VCBS repeat-containing protein [Clostridium swellfunianum]
MKFRVIFLKKKHIYYSVLVTIILILSLILLLTRKSSPTFNTLVDNNKLLQSDLTGDGKKDILYIKTEKDKYYMEVNTGEKSLLLEPDKKLPTVGIYDVSNPLKVTLMDITRDKTPEIFVQASQKETPLQHVFMWSEGKFKDIFCASNSIIGFSDCTNNKTPRFMTGKLTSNKIELSTFMYMHDVSKLENVVFNYKDNYMGKDSIFSFIKYIEALPGSEPNKPANIFYPGLSGQDISVIGKIAGENNTYAFQNCIFRDSKSDKNGDTSEITWTLNFKGISNLNKDKIKNYSLNVLLKPNGKAEENNYFKIYSITLD